MEETPESRTNGLLTKVQSNNCNIRLQKFHEAG